MTPRHLDASKRRFIASALWGALAINIPALAAGEKWDGPWTGPMAQPGKTVIFLSQDFRNGGITAVFRSFSMAAAHLHWHVRLQDGAGSAQTIKTQLIEAIRSHPDAIVLGGFQVDPELAPLCAQARQSGIVLAGWHAGADPGPVGDLYVNVATASNDVAQAAASYVIEHGAGNIGVVLINDSRFAVANAKTRSMLETFAKCRRCTVLSVEDVPISEAGARIPKLVTQLDGRFGKSWTHTLAINDVYFDEINFPLMHAGRTDVQNISAGDGSNSAISRIKSGKSQQVATVAEPLGLQGWQLADELNRAFAGRAPSGYLTRPILVTTAFLQALGGADFDSPLPYREAYSLIWNGKTSSQ